MSVSVQLLLAHPDAGRQLEEALGKFEIDMSHMKVCW